MSAAPDEALVERAAQGDGGALDVIVRRHEGLLLRIAYGLLGHGHDAQDAVQEAFIALYRNLGRLDVSRPGAVRAYLATCTRNAAFDRLREGRRHPGEDLDLHAADPALRVRDGVDALEQDEDRRVLARCLGELPARQRSVVVLRYPCALPAQEVQALLTELGFPEDEAHDLAAADTQMKIREIAAHGDRLGVSTVGGVGNLLKRAMAVLRRCFEEALGLGAQASPGSTGGSRP